MVAVAAGLTACSKGGGPATATDAQFPGVRAVATAAYAMGRRNRDAHPRAEIVKTSLRAFFDQQPTSDPARNRVIYGVRLEGTFTCEDCTPLGASPSHLRVISFTWNPTTHRVLDVGYGSGPDLRRLGHVYALQLPVLHPGASSRHRSRIGVA
jgi:hypothetical protein